MDIKLALTNARQQAIDATNNHLSTYGDRDMCGFAWVKVMNVRINSKVGKELVAVGFRKSYTGGLDLWNPSNSFTQAITAKEKGAEAYAQVLRDQLGLEAYSQSRLD